MRSALRLSWIFVGTGVVLQSPGCGSICPNSRAKIPVFDANLCVCACIIVKTAQPAAAATP